MFIWSLEQNNNQINYFKDVDIIQSVALPPVEIRIGLISTPDL